MFIATPVAWIVLAVAQARSLGQGLMQSEGGASRPAGAAVESEVGVDALDLVTGFDAVYRAEDDARPGLAVFVAGVDEVLGGVREGVDVHAR